jgi:hypothetical protein
MWAIFKKRKLQKQQKENMEIVQLHKSENQEKVFEAVSELNDQLIRAVNGREVAAHLKWDSASVTNRLAELTKKHQLKVAYRKKGLDGIWRNFYRSEQ